MAEPGQIFARRYRLVREIGRGAMGVVYEAVHETLDHKVAIKVLKRGVTQGAPGARDEADERAIHRFEREARLAAKLDSEHVVKVLDVDRTEDDEAFLVMERLEGRDLATEVEARGARDQTGVSIAEAASWGLAIADAMIAAHTAGIIHRYLKLSNVFLTTAGVVKVLDFGVAAFQGGDADASTTMNVAGTPRYMAPEQLLGEAPNPASDVWALGVILYRLLCGRFPYDAPTMAAQMLAIMQGAKPLEELAPQVPAALATVVHRALGRTLEERWPTMSALREALAPFASGDAGEPPPVRRPEAEREPLPSPKSPRRWAMILAASTVGAALVALGLRAATTRSHESPTTTPTTTAGPRASIEAQGETTLRASPTLDATAPPPPVAESAPHASTTGSRPREATPVRRPAAPMPSASPKGALTGSSGDGFPTHL